MQFGNITAIFLIFCALVRLSDATSNMQKVLKSYDLAANLGEENRKRTVNCSLHIQRLGDLSKMVDFEVDLYLKLTWLEELFLNLDGMNLTEPLDLRNPEQKRLVWYPDVYFPNAKQEEFQFLTSPNILLRILPNGTVCYMTRLKLTFSCISEMAGYPLDFQKCAIQLSVFSRREDQVALRWHHQRAVTLQEEFNPGAIDKTEFFLGTCNMTLQSGSYSCLRVDIKMQRSIGHHLVQNYLPSIMIVAISWVSFWLDAYAVPARVTLGVMTLLTITSESINQKATLPPVSRVKALDIWMGACTIFVFAALVEYTAVNYVSRGAVAKSPSTSSSLQRPSIIYLHYKVLHKPKKKKSKEKLKKMKKENYEATKKRKRTAKRLDQISRLLFPLVFVLFNCVYWPYYFR